MDIQTEILQELKAINMRLASNESRWITAEEACNILGYFGKTSNRKLRKLRQSNHLTKTSGLPIRYFKAEVYQVLNKLLTGEIKPL